jgi:tRNA pseudouridine38-40 synthase
MKRFLLRINYDGTNFKGWQSQKHGRTVQDTLESVLSEITKANITVVGSGRTDAGVHAIRQYAHFDLNLNITPDQLIRAINSKLPDDLKITNVFQVVNNFHARYDAEKRVYKYMITSNKSPFNRFYKTCFHRKIIAPENMEKCLHYFIGEYDFTSFSKSNPDIKSNICTINNFELHKENEDLVFILSANRFLHNMVRRIIGTIVNISHANIDPEIINKLINRKNPSHKLISTAPPQGLYLLDVRYPENLFI